MNQILSYVTSSFLSEAENLSFVTSSFYPKLKTFLAGGI